MSASSGPGRFHMDGCLNHGAASASTMKKLLLVLALATTAGILFWLLSGGSQPSPKVNLVIMEPGTAPGKGAGKKPLDPAKARAQIEAAVKSGKLTREQADAKLDWVRNQSAPAQPKP